MKILKITLQNLNALKGTHSVNLNVAPLKSASLFAITGETGAGKSTLLDAITLALYGKVARGCDSAKMMSQGTGESMAEVEFACNGQCYRAKWQQRRARGKAIGTVQAAKYELALLSEDGQKDKIIAEKFREVRDKIKDLVRLDYEQFTRAILLAQGDFAQFLDADEKERGALLEKIAGNTIYGKLSSAAFQRAKAEKTKVEQLRTKIDSERLLETEQRDAMTLEYQQLQANSQTLSGQIQVLQQQQADLQRQQDLTQQLQDLTVEFTTLESQQQAFKPQQQKLDLHTRFIVFKSDWETRQQLFSSIEQTQQALAHSEHEKKQLDKTVKAAQDALQQAEKRQQQAMRELEEQRPLIQQALQWNVQIKQQQDICDKSQQSCDKTKKHLKSKRTRHSKQEKQLKKIQGQQTEVADWLEEHAAAATLEVELFALQAQQEKLAEQQQDLSHQRQQQEDLKTQQVQLQAALLTQQKTLLKTQKKCAREKAAFEQLQQDCQQAYDAQQPAVLLEQRDELLSKQEDLKTGLNLALTLEKQTQHLARDKTQQQDKNTALQLLLDAESDLEKQLAAQKTQLQQAQSLYEQAQQLKNYEQARQALEENQPCPLCGSKQHPLKTDYVDHSDAIGESLEQAKQSLADYQQQWDKQQQTQAGLQAEVTVLTRQVQETQEDVTGLQEDFAVLDLVFAPADIKILQQHIEQNETKISGLKTAIKKLTSSEKKQQKSKDLQQQQQDEQDKLAHKINALNVEEKHLLETLAVLQQEQKQFQQACLQLLEKQQLVPEPEQQPEQQPEQWLASLQQRLEKWSSQQQKAEDLQLESVQVASTQTELAAQIAEENKQLSTLQSTHESDAQALAQLQQKRRDCFPADNPQAVLETLSKTLETCQQQLSEQQRLCQKQRDALTTLTEQQRSQQQLLQEQQARYQTQQTVLEDKVQAAGLETLEQLPRQWLDEETLAGALQQQKDLETRVAQCQRSELDTRAALEKLQTQLPPDVTLEAVNSEQQSLQENQQALHQHMGKLEEQLTADKKLRQQFATIEQERQAQEKIWSDWAKLDQLIGSEKGDKFRKYAQGLTLEQLLGLANQHLQKLNPRYRMRREPDKELMLEIIDSYQADYNRPMNTLSGGERFLVSLALALGLSDLARRNVEIGSLFIDEGFGTLDGHTLDMALATLENLQSQGAKQIGIISHVEMLKERIPVQIQVQKQGQGHSDIRIVA
ncbi:AAA family ATPase [Candidatus Venteria ishoeyi]|uniref:AAA family ATPase n=1 Tax=Candidatus Venteria ishoeyi TaxID=1899563 RepID=UPI0025A58A03|nr:AAA family ATPase [Candidatus Venteria ishoeyi]MDM8548286.1 AAA family ATPase [Candidatus Venteria ishoeyi]